MRPVRSRLRGVVALGALGVSVALAGLAARPRMASAHPLHTTITEVTHLRERQTLRLMIRVFADDFEKAVVRRTPAPRGAVTDAATLAYLRSAVVVSQGSRSLPLSACGSRRAGEVIWLCVETPAPASLAGVQLRVALLSEMFEDQVNIVRSLVGASPRSLLFTRGDGGKSLL